MYTIVAPVPANLVTILGPYRQKYDPTIQIVSPHIAILEPFQFTAPPEQLYTHLNQISETYAPFKVFLVGWHIHEGKDYQLRLPMTAGQAELTSLRQDILTGPLSILAGGQKIYQPHVFFGRLTDQADLEAAKQDLKGFEPLFNFRVSRLELWQRDEAKQPWQVEMKFALKATLAGKHKPTQTQDSSY